MGNDTDRLQQMEDNWNGEDYNIIYNALGLQQKMQRDLAKLNLKNRLAEQYENALDYYLNEGYPQDLAEIYAERDAELLEDATNKKIEGEK